MRRLIQHPAAWVMVLASVASFGLLRAREPAPGAGGQKLPVVGPVKHAKYTDNIPGTEVRFEMVPVPGGTFLMGSPATEKGRNADEGPQHPVRVEPFWMGKFEVTWDEFDEWWKENPGNKQEQMRAEKKGAQGKDLDAISRPTPPYADETFGRGREGHPVLGISYHAAMEYCHWLSNKTGKVYRLPTEAEWEWACRAGTVTAYSFGNDPAKLGEHACFGDNSEDKTFKVGSKKPNPWGLYDMHGNVAEWCLDEYNKLAYNLFPANKITLGPVVLPKNTRFPHVVRGGSWADEAAQLRSAARMGSKKDWIKQDPQQPQSIWWLTDGDFVGFRLVRAVHEQDNLKGIRSKVKWSSK